MPELPEVETVCRSLKPHIIGQYITNIDFFRDKLRYLLPLDKLKTCHNKRIIDVYRRAKYLIITLDNELSIVVHLGMSGRFILNSSGFIDRLKHDHVIFTLSNNSIITFNDSRRFGLIDVVTSSDLLQHKYFIHLGPEPLNEEFNSNYLQMKLQKSNVPIKNFIMDARVVVGVGNIYASESLYLAKIKPTRASKSLHTDEIDRLIAAIKTTLEKAILAGGSTLKDFVSSQGESGYFQKSFSVYGKDKTNCLNCVAPIIKIVQAGRATFYCNICQV